MPRLENWSLRWAGNEPDDVYKAPELRGMALQGVVYDHPDHADGTQLVTSPIMSVSGRAVQTRNTLYELGQVDPDYAAWCAREFPERECRFDSDYPLGEGG